MKDAQPIFILAMLASALGMWLLLPRGTGRGRMSGTLLAAAGLGLWASPMPRLGNWIEDGVFLVLGGATLVAATATLSLRNPAHCAIAFAASLFGTAGLFLLTGARWPVVAAVVAYAICVLVAFRFVFTPALYEGRANCQPGSWEPLVSAATGIAIAGILSITVAGVLEGPQAAAAGPSATELPGGVPEGQRQIALLHNYLVVAALLFGIGMIGLFSRRESIVTLLCAQMTLQGAAISLVAFSRFHRDFGGQVLVIFVIAAAASQAAVALALIPVLFRRSGKPSCRQASIHA